MLLSKSPRVLNTKGGCYSIFGLALLLFHSAAFGKLDTTVGSEVRQWTFKNGTTQTLQLKNAYGGTVYFADKKGSTTFANIVALIPEDQAEVVYWSRVRDTQIFDTDYEPTEFTTQFERDAFRLQEKKLVRSEWQAANRAPEFYAIYTSASWCKPCRGFTPKLVSFYNSTKDFFEGQYEMVLCSWDQSQTDMIAYMLEEDISWYGNWKSRTSKFWRQYQGSGIPCLVVVDRNGFVLAHSYDSEGYLGPTSALNRFREILTHASGFKGERISVPTPGIDLGKLNTAVNKHKQTVKREGKAAPPSLAYGPDVVLQNLESEEAEEIEIKARLTISPRGMVTDVELVNANHPKLEKEITKAVMLWQFIPSITAEGQEESSIVAMPFHLKLKDEYRTEEFSLLTD